MPAPNSADLAAIFNMPPAEAVRYLEAKGYRITFNWHEMLDEAHARAFTVAKAMRLDILHDIRSGLLSAIDEGKTLRQFQDDLVPMLQAKGWWGKAVHVDEITQDAQLVQLGSFRRLRTIYQTNLQSAYMAGRFKRQMQADAFPYLMYVAVMDGRTRPSHAALNGKVYRKDDPIWDTHYPPNGFNCRCRTRALTAGQVRREGLSVGSSDGQVVTKIVNAGVDKLTGEVSKTTITGIRTTGQDGKPTVMWTDPGFSASPVASHLMDDLIYQKAKRVLGQVSAIDALRDVVLSEPRLKTWDAFVENSADFGFKQGQTMTVGVLPLAMMTIEAMPVLFAEDRLIVGKKASRHEAKGDALSLLEWKSLPRLLQGAIWYRDTRNGNSVALLENGTAVIADSSGAVVSAYRDTAAQEKISRGIWVEVR